jgi:cytochrome c biogenesis protein CcdA
VLIIGLCAVTAGTQVARIARRLIVWRRRQEPIPAFGQVDLVYFYEPTCPACRTASPRIEAIRRRYPRYRVAGVNTTDPAGIALQEEYNRAYGVPRREQDHIPAVFAGRRYFIGADAIDQELPAYLAAGPLSRPVSPPREAGAALLARRFHSLGAAPVVLAGLVDSVNPCAIATLVFFLSYLALGGRRPRDLLWIGGLFTVGTFTTYFLIGLGLLRVLHSLRFFPVLGRALYPTAALVTLALAGFSFHDFRQARQGARMSLQLPRRVTLRIHQVIRSQLGLRRIAAAAFTSAVLVSTLQFVCTSQIYLPALMYMAQAGDQRLRAIGLLALYNLAFVLPLIGIVTAAAYGVSTRRLAQLAVRHAAGAKLAMSLLFVGFTVYLVSISVRLFSTG